MSTVLPTLGCWTSIALRAAFSKPRRTAWSLVLLAESTSMATGRSRSVDGQVGPGHTLTGYNPTIAGVAATANCSRLVANRQKSRVS